MPDSPTPIPHVIAIGASGGDGLRAIKALLAELPADLPAVVLVVLHRPSHLPSELQRILARACTIPVVIARDGQMLRVGVSYIGEPAAHLTLGGDGRAILVDGSAHRHRGHTVDILFRSVADHAAEHGIGVVLSGSLDDGARGLAAIVGRGGWPIVLGAGGVAEAGMPRNAAIMNSTVEIIPTASEIALRLVRLLQRPPVRERPGFAPAASAAAHRIRS